jgi:sulfhydrogenase subunit beta (sulfur reductase)
MVPVDRMGSEARVVIDADQLSSLFAALQSTGYRVIGPTVRSGAIVLEELATSADLPAGWTDSQGKGSYVLSRHESHAMFSHGPGPHTWKRWLYPPLTRLFHAIRRGSEFAIIPNDEVQPRLALLGVRACDLHALARLDRILTGPREDRQYAERRRQAFLIAIPCRQPGANCFCASMGCGPDLPEGFDLGMTEVLDGKQHYFVVQVASNRAAELLQSGVAFHFASKEEQQAAARVVQGTSHRMGWNLDPHEIRRRLLGHLQDQLWDAAASRCLTCGSCTMVCPTCFCTTLEDSTDLPGTRAERWRRWDSCFTRDFSYLHGAVVRSTPMSRYRQRLLHKFVTWMEQFGTFGCVGCGRCITWCPAGADLMEEVGMIGEGS